MKRLRKIFLFLFLIVLVILIVSFSLKEFGLGIGRGGGEGGEGVKRGTGEMEKFYTLFTPYKYDSDDMIKKYVNLTTSTDYNYNTLTFGIPFRHDFKEMYIFMEQLIKTIIAYSPILKFDLMKYESSQEVCLAVKNRNVNMGVVSEPIMIDAITGFNKIFNTRHNFDNLRFVANIGNQYIYLIVRKDSKINKLQDLQGKKINVGQKSTSVWKTANDVLSFIGLRFGSDFKKYHMTHYESIYAMLMGQLDAMFYTDYYPSNFLTDIFESYDKKHEFTLLPIDDFNKSNFLLSYYYYNSTTIDLNKMPQTFLPMKSGGRHFNRFNPDLPTFSFNQVIIANRETDGDTVYKFTKYYYENIRKFKQSPVFNKDKANLFGLSVDSSLVFIHRGAYKYYKELGYVVENEDSEDCKYLIGKTRCNKRNLEMVKHSIN